MTCSKHKSRYEHSCALCSAELPELLRYIAERQAQGLLPEGWEPAAVRGAARKIETLRAALQELNALQDLTSLGYSGTNPDVVIDSKIHGPRKPETVLRDGFKAEDRFPGDVTYDPRDPINFMRQTLPIRSEEDDDVHIQGKTHPDHQIDFARHALKRAVGSLERAIQKRTEEDMGEAESKAYDKGLMLIKIGLKYLKKGSKRRGR